MPISTVFKIPLTMLCLSVFLTIFSLGGPDLWGMVLEKIWLFRHTNCFQTGEFKQSFVKAAKTTAHYDCSLRNIGL